MKKRLLSAILIIFVVFAAVGCSYTFTARISEVYLRIVSNDEPVSSGKVYIIDNEVDAEVIQEIIDNIEAGKEEDRKVEDYVPQQSQCDITDGTFNITFHWVTSSPMGGKDFDVKTIWVAATDGTKWSDVIKTSISSDNSTNSTEIVIE